MNTSLYIICFVWGGGRAEGCLSMQEVLFLERLTEMRRDMCIAVQFISRPTIRVVSHL